MISVANVHKEKLKLATEILRSAVGRNYCPHCGALMDQGVHHKDCVWLRYLQIVEYEATLPIKELVENYDNDYIILAEATNAHLTNFAMQNEEIIGLIESLHVLIDPKLKEMVVN